MRFTPLLVALVVADLVHGETTFCDNLLERHASVRVLAQVLARGSDRLSIFFGQSIVVEITISFEFSRTIVQWHLTLSGKLHEGLDRRLAKLSRPPERYFVFPEKLQRKQTSRIGGRVGAVQLSRFRQVFRELYLY
ncbi:MAG: hypothetical protein JWO48_2316 [Bryobacterales bacterium]|nr:hypothetical protein [Bryobacterales bacterium]